MATDEEVGDIRSLAVVHDRGLVERPADSGIARLARMSDDAFAEHLALMKTGYSRLKEVQRSLMVPGVHYGMPGAKPEDLQKLKDEGKVGLYKAGAELLCQMLGFVAGRPELKIEYGDPVNETSPAIIVHSVVPVHRGDASGPVVGVGVGAWSTWEIKNRYRTAQRACPECGKTSLLRQNEAKGGRFKGHPAWWCVPGREGCGKDFAGDDARITGQQVGRETNKDAADLLNTGVKMSTKRAFVDGTIRASGSSDLFTQDVEDMNPADLQSRERKTAQGAEESLRTMYGDAPEVDPDAWRAGVETPPAAPVAAASASAAPSPVTAPSDPQLATEKQRGAVVALLRSKLGAKSDDAVDLALKVRLHVSGGMAAMTKAEASTIIGSLGKMPDYVDAEASQEDPLQDTTKNRDWGADKVKQLAALAESVTGRKILSNEDGILMVVGSIELTTLKMTRPVPLAYLDVAALLSLSQHLRREVERKEVTR